MKIKKIFLFKNEDKKEDKHPDLRLSGLGEDGNFYPLGSLWKQTDGKKGFKGNPHELADINIMIVNPNLGEVDLETISRRGFKAPDISNSDF